MSFRDVGKWWPKYFHTGERWQQRCWWSFDHGTMMTKTIVKLKLILRWWLWWWWGRWDMMMMVMMMMVMMMMMIMIMIMMMMMMMWWCGDDDDDGNDEEDSNGDETTMMMMIWWWLGWWGLGWRCFCPSVLTVESLPKRYSSRHTPGIIEKAHGKKIRMSSVFFCIIHKRYSLRSSLRSTHEFCSHCHCLFVILLQSSKVFTSFRELALFHALTHIVVDKSTLRVPEPCRMNCVLTNWWSHLHSAWNVEWHHACAEAWTFTSGKSTVFDPCVPTRIGKMHAFSVSWFMLWGASRTKTQRYKAFGQCFQPLLLSVQHSKKPTFTTVAVVVAHVVTVVLVVVVPLLSFLSSLLLLLLSFISLFSLFSVSCPQPSPPPSASFLPLLFFKPISISNTCVS